MSWPPSKVNIRDFVTWAVTVKKLKPSTVGSYISSLSFILKINDFDCSCCSDSVTKLLIKGAENLSFYKELSSNQRKVMTLPLLNILGHQIANSGWKSDSQQVFWTAVVVAFFGSFRFGEILCPSENSFNSKECLLWEDISFTNDSVTIHIKIPKSRNLKSEFIDLFKINGKSYCPVSALTKLKRDQNPSLKSPVFKFCSGSLLTSQSLNSSLRELLLPVIGASATHISGHSFRAALPSALANRPDLASDEDIKNWGRWSGASFRLYTILKPQQKRIIFSKIISSLSSL